jgi:hypothetical protein
MVPAGSAWMKLWATAVFFPLLCPLRSKLELKQGHRRDPNKTWKLSGNPSFIYIYSIAEYEVEEEKAKVQAVGKESALVHQPPL